MNCTIQWNSLSLEEWEDRFSRIRQANLLQSYQYAQAICPLNHQKARWGLIKIDGQEAGLVQILEAGILNNAIHGIVLDRGPLWFEGFGQKEHIETFFTAFNKEFPRRFGRRRRLLPEIENDNKISFKDMGYKSLEKPGYQTIWLDLTQNPETLKSGLKPNWRNRLSKAERSNLTVQWDDSCENLSWLLTNYKLDQATKGYDGPSAKLVQHLAKAFAKQDRLLIGRATLDNQAVAAILILCHGTSATYQVGFSFEDGRKAAAHNLLLWQAVCHLKKKGFYDFDLGGINDDTAQGVKKFKEGMGGQTVTYVGHYF